MRLAHDLAHVFPRNPPDDVLEPLREGQEGVQVFRHEVVGGNNTDAPFHGLVKHVFADHVVALDMDHIRLDLVEQQADFLLDFPGEADAEVLVGWHAV